MASRFMQVRCHRQENQGLSGARNAGARQADGDLVLSNAQYGAAILTIADTTGAGTWAGAFTVSGQLNPSTNVVISGKSMTLGGEEVVTAMNTAKYGTFQGTATNGQTVTTGVTFGANPQVFLSWDANALLALPNASTNSAIVAANGISTTQFTVYSPVPVTEATGVYYTVIGTRPD
jgi:hypothetical protein